mgnify:FL=1
MKKEIDKVLPLGSVVLLKDAKRYLVVIGYLIIEDGSNKVWDYMGCAYPVGAISSEATLVFDTEQIDKVIFEGYSDKEGEAFREKVSKSIGDEK